MSRRVVELAVTTGVLLLAATALSHAPFLVWNASASAPIGLYRVVHRPPLRDDLVLVPTPASVAMLAAVRGYVPLHVPLVKRVAAMAGDHVCTRGDSVVIDHSVTAMRVAFDPNHRPLPYWEGCRPLRAGELFLLTRDAPHSFDSRYFGPVPAASVIGVLRPLWTR